MKTWNLYIVHCRQDLKFIYIKIHTHERNKKNSNIHKVMNWKHKTLCLFLTVIFIFSINIAIAPLNKMKEFENLVNSDSIFLEKYDDIYNHPEMRPLVKEKVFKEALLKLAESDSIQLVINLSDSSVNLIY